MKILDGPYLFMDVAFLFILSKLVVIYLLFERGGNKLAHRQYQYQRTPFCNQMQLLEQSVVRLRGQVSCRSDNVPGGR